MNESVDTKEKIVMIVKNNKHVIFEYGVRRLGLFGSFLHERQSKRSDVDILVEFDPEKKTYDNFIQLSFFLEDAFGRSVELVTPEALSPYIAPHILSEIEYVI